MLKYFLLTVIATLGLVSSASAATITPGPLTITYNGNRALFSEANISPGDEVTKTLTVRNDGRVSHNFSIATRNVTGVLAERISLSAIEEGRILWTRTVADLENPSSQSQVVTLLSPGQTKLIDIKARFSDSSGTSYSDKNVSFDIIYGTEEPEPSAGLFNSFSTDRNVQEDSSVTASATPGDGSVKGDDTEGNSANPYYLVIAPAAVLAAVILAPEFAIAAGVTALAGGAAYVLGWNSGGGMTQSTFFLLIILEIMALIIIGYFLLHHDNRASRKIRKYRHRLRIR